MKPRVLVIGAGVSGLSTAIRLLENRYPVEIWTKDPPLETTSRVAAACWYPFLVEPKEAAVIWGGIAFREFEKLAAQDGTGVMMRRTRILFEQKVPDPEWKEVVPTFRRAEPSDLIDGYVDGFILDVPVIEMPVYLPWLADRFIGGGGTIRVQPIADLSEALRESSIVINCTGLASRELADDREVYPVRGQVVVVDRGDIEEMLFDPEGKSGVAYIVPRSTDCVLGGTEDESNDLTIDEATAQSIIARCGRLDKRVTSAKRLDNKVGLRPCRSQVRLEAESPQENELLIHNYGHGGAGVTLSWGCAEEVAIIVNEWTNPQGGHPPAN